MQLQDSILRFGCWLYGISHVCVGSSGFSGFLLSLKHTYECTRLESHPEGIPDSDWCLIRSVFLTHDAHSRIQIHRITAQDEFKTYCNDIYDL